MKEIVQCVDRTVRQQEQEEVQQECFDIPKDLKRDTRHYSWRCKPTGHQGRFPRSGAISVPTPSSTSGVNSGSTVITMRHTHSPYISASIVGITSHKVTHANGRHCDKWPPQCHQGRHKEVNAKHRVMQREHDEFIRRLEVLRTDFAYRADRLIPCVRLSYVVTSTSPWRGLSALELLLRGQLQLRVYSVIESPKYFKAKLTRYCS